MKKTTLVVMAAGIGSRFGGGIKQLEPVGPSGEIIMDYSIHDALEAGFKKRPGERFSRSDRQLYGEDRGDCLCISGGR